MRFDPYYQKIHDQFPKLQGLPSVAEEDPEVAAAFGDFAEDLAPSDEATRSRREQARAHLIDFTTFTFPQYIVDPFHEHVAGELDKVVHGEISNLMLFAPPQHGKSELVSTRLPSYWLAHNPDLPVALVSYAASLANRNSRNARAVFQSPQYMQLFPSIRPDPENQRITDWHVRDHKGYVMAVGVGGPITGHGFGLGLIDDPVENWAAAQSELQRETIWQWWQGTFKTRMWEHGRIIFMMTRWHEDDLAARILDQEGRVEEGGKWTVRKYPALSVSDEQEGVVDLLSREYGEALAPSRYSSGYLRDLQTDVGPLVWSAEYQQSPSPPQGRIFKIGRVSILDPERDALPAEIGEVVGGVLTEVRAGHRFWDLAATAESLSSRDPDYVTATLMAHHEGKYYVLDQIRERLDPEQVERLVFQTAELDGPAVHVTIEQEPGASGKMLVEYFIRELAGYKVEGQVASGDKVVRAQPFAGQLNAGNVILLKGPWNRAWLQEHAQFNQGRYDDQVDSSSGAFSKLAQQRRRWRDQRFDKV